MSIVYVANSLDNTVAVISTDFNVVTTFIPVDVSPQIPVVAEKNHFPPLVYVTNAGSGTVSVIDASSQFAFMSILVGANPSGIAISPDEQIVYALNRGPNTISVIQTSSNSVIATIPLSGSPNQGAFANNGNRAYVTLQDGNTAVIDTTTNTVITLVPVGTAPAGVAVTPDSSRVYVANSGDGTVSVIDAITNTVIATIPAGTTPLFVAVSPDGTTAYVTDAGGPSVTVIDTLTNSVVGTIPLSGPTAGVVFDPLESLAYVVESSNRVLTIIDTVGRFPINSIPVGNGPFGVAVLSNFNSIATIEIIKIDRTTGALLSGAVFGIFNEFGQILFEITTDFDGRAKIQVPSGRYIIRELVSPPGYIVEIPEQFVDAFPGSVTFLEFFNIRAVSENYIQKIDAETSLPIPGVQFDVFDEFGNLVQSVITDSNGIAVIFVPPGLYTIKEITPPGYEENPPLVIFLEGYTFTTISNRRILSPSIDLTKQVDRIEALPGDLIHYTIIVTNNGDAFLHNVIVTDSLVMLQEQIAELPPGESVAFSVPFVVPDLPGGSVIRNISTVVTDEGVSAEAEADVQIIVLPSIQIVKTPDRAAATPSTPIVYTVDVTNTGNVPLTNVTLKDSLVPISEPPFTLEIGETKSFQYVLTFDPSFVRDGVIENTATVTTNETPPVTANSTVIVLPEPGSLGIRKSVSSDTAMPGDVVVYTIEVFNNGVTRLTNVVLQDEVLQLHLSIGDMEPGEAFLLDIPFTIESTQAGQTIVNTAIVESITNGERLTAADTASVNIIAAPSIGFAKTVNQPHVQQGGAVIYTLSVVNTGVVPLTNVRITDPTLSFQTIIPTLQPNEVRSFDVSFTVPLSVPAGTILLNTATVVSDQTEAQESEATVSILPTFQVEIFKTAETASASPGETVAYTVVVRNTGGADLTNIVILDPAIGLNQSIAKLVPGEAVDFRAFFTIPENTPAGEQIRNTATVTTAETEPATDETVIVVLAAPLLAVEKTSDVGVVLPGGTVVYSITVHNTGNIPLTNVVVNDPVIGFNTTIPTLAVGASQTFTVPYIVPISAPHQTVLVNTVVAVSDQTPAQEAMARVAIDPPLGLTVSKTADRTSVLPGDTVQYTITVVNGTGFALTGVNVSDPLIGLDVRFEELAAGESRVLTGTFLVPTTVLEGSMIVNTTTVTSDQTETLEATATVTVLPAPKIDIDKTANVASAFPGETVIYSLTVTNVGNMPLTGVHLTDTLIGLDATLPLLEVGATEVIKQPFTIPLDAPAGTQFVNTVTVETDQLASDQASASVVVEPGFSLSLEKSVDKPAALPGEQIHYTVTLRNQSNAEVTNVRFVDSLIGLSEWITNIPSGAFIVLVIGYVIPATAAAGSIIRNTVTMLSDQTPPQQASASVTVGAAPKLGLSKTVVPDQARPGQTVTFLIRIANEGNVRLSPVTLVDPLLGVNKRINSFPENIRVLAQVFGVISVPFVIPDTAKPGSIITNTARAESGQTEPVTASASVHVLESLLKVTKQVNVKEVTVGDRVEYTITVQNIGSIAARDIILFDNPQGGSTFIPGSVKINGSVHPKLNPIQGIPLGTLSPGDIAVVRFRVETTRPNRLLMNDAIAEYVYTGQFGSNFRAAARSNRTEVVVEEEEE